MTRAALIAKLRTAAEYLFDDQRGALVWLSRDEMDRLIQDLEYAEFSHQALEGGDLPECLRKQAG